MNAYAGTRALIRLIVRRLALAVDLYRAAGPPCYRHRGWLCQDLTFRRIAPRVFHL